MDNPYALTFAEPYARTECTAELSTCCYAGTLMLQAMGLGRWMFDGIDWCRGNVMKTAAFTPPHESLCNDFRGNSNAIAPQYRRERST